MTGRRRLRGIPIALQGANCSLATVALEVARPAMVVLRRAALSRQRVTAGWTLGSPVATVE